MTQKAPAAEKPAKEKAPAAEKPAKEKAPAAEKPAGRREERKPITTTTERGDWVDPFSNLTVAAGNDINPTNGARRDGDEAVLYVTD